MKNSGPLLKIYDLLHERFGSRHWWPGDSRIEIIIGAILTQNTAWTNVEKAISNLKKYRLLNIKALRRISEGKLAELIRPSGYYNIKASRVKNFLRFLETEYAGNLNKMFGAPTALLRKQLLGVKGIGEETADSILLYAGEKPAFVIDAYTKRIFSRHGFIGDDADYSEAQALFTKNMPRSVKLFNEYHALIVELGKNICRAKNPLCVKCPIRRIRWQRK